MKHVHMLTLSLYREGYITCCNPRVSTFAKQNGIYAEGIALTEKGLKLLQDIVKKNEQGSEVNAADRPPIVRHKRVCFVTPQEDGRIQ